MKVCLKCGITKDISLFCKDKRRSDGVSPYCKSCRDVYYKEISKKSYSLNKEFRKNKELTKRSTVNGRIARMLINAKSRAKKNNLPFNIDKSDIRIPLVCPLTGINITLEVDSKNRTARDSTVSLDRIVPELGYVKGSVRVISYLANKIKNNASKEVLITFAKNIESYLNGEGSDR
jgi:hypothetical protein